MTTKKANLSWTLSDYLKANEEPPQCVIGGITEGQAMREDEVRGWVADEIRSISVIKEEYPDAFESQHENFLLDLEYLKSLGKITEEELDRCKDKGIFNFGQE